MSNGNSGTIAVWGVILTAVSILIGVCNNAENKRLEAERIQIQIEELRMKKAKDSIEQAEKFQQKLDAYNEKVYKVMEEDEQASRNGQNQPVLFVFKTNSTESIRFCITYLSMSGKWMTQGHFEFNSEKPYYFSNKTCNKIIYFTVESNNGQDITDRIISIDNAHVSNYSISLDEMREFEGFTIIQPNTPPFKTVRRKFYKINAAGQFKFIDVKLQS